MKKILFLFSLLVLATTVSAQLNADEALAMQYYQNGDYEKAATMFDELLRKSKNQSYYDPLFTSYLKSKNYEKADALARKYHKLYPEQYSYAVDIGRVYQDKGELEDALTWYDGLVRKIPANEFAIKDLAINFYRAEAYDYSIKTYMLGRKILNDEKAFIFDLISIYRFRKDKPMLVHEYLQLLADNPDLVGQARNVFSNILEEDADLEMLRITLLKRLQKEPQNVAFTELLTWQYIQQKDFDAALRQTLALDRRLKEDGARVYELSRMLLANQAYDQAVEALEYLLAKGEGFYYIPAKIELLNTRTNQLTSQKFNQEELLKLEVQYLSLLTEFGKSAGTSFAIRQLANLRAFYLNRADEAAKNLEELLSLPNLPDQVIAGTKLELGDIYILTGEVWEAALLFGQVEKQFANEPSGQEAKFKNARLSYYQGDFVWAKAQLDVLKSATSQLIANDALNLSLLISDNLQNSSDSAALRQFARADHMIFTNQAENALILLDSINISFPGNSLSDDILMAKARIYIKRKKTDKALTQLQQIITSYPEDLWGDDAIFMSAEILQSQPGQEAKTLALYEKIIIDYPGSLYVIEARKRFRHIRGDSVPRT